MIDRRQAIKAIMAAATGAALPLPAVAADMEIGGREEWAGAPILMALLRHGDIVVSQPLPHATIRQNGNGVAIYGDPVTFSGLSGRYDDARIVLLFAPGAVLAIPIPTFTDQVRGIDFDKYETLTIQWSGGLAARVDLA